MRVEDLTYELPEAAIAQQPVEPRDAARLLVSIADEPLIHRNVSDLGDLVGPGDLIVVNDTRVLPARLRLFKESGGAVEVFLLSPRNEQHSRWEALLRPSKRIAVGATLAEAPGGAPIAVAGPVIDEDGTREVELAGVADPAAAEALLDSVGVVPLPPYIHAELADPDRYQTVFARVAGSVAAPTAGLHLTDAVLDRCRGRGASIATVTLDVGLGTFRPMTAARVEDHRMHSERYTVPPETIAAIERADRVIAIGTTTLRSLESWAATGVVAGATQLFIHGDYSFRVVDRLLTNFHLPGSSLLALLDAFTGPRWRDLYATALAEGYRFLSFGDAMFVDRATR